MDEIKCQIQPQSLHHEFVKLGRERNKITYKLLSLLPKIYQSQIYKKYGCATIHEYAGKFGGLSNGVVSKALKLHENLKDKPFLQKAVESQGIHKVAILAKIATPETDRAFADKVENMSKAGVQALSKEIRHNSRFRAENENENKNKIENENKNVNVNVNENENENECAIFTYNPDTLNTSNLSQKCHAAPTKMTIELDDETQFLFLKLKKELKVNSNKEALKLMLQKLINRSVKFYQNINPEKVQNFPGEKMDDRSEILPNNQSDNINKAPCCCIPTHINKANSRYIPASIKKSALQKSNFRCAYPGCNKPAEVFHHTNRYADSRNHESVICLCRDHHEFAHNGIIKNEKSNPQCWELNLTRQSTLFADKLYKKHRKIAA
ncbi:MAG: hypothetical protein KJ687_05695 [Proteobacteria bacterium]|nr:hypothetical protein [Pseudomonadota bacterium]